MIHKPHVRVACTGLVVAIAMAAGPADTARYRHTSAGGACHVANGGAAGKFTFNNHYLTNIGTTDQYVICHFEMDDPTALPNSVDYLGVQAFAPYPDMTVTCVAQTGNYVDGTVNLQSSVARSYTTFGANAPFALEWIGALTRQNVTQVLTLNCKVPPGAKLGLITRTESETY
jgi:hypothetical protein